MSATFATDFPTAPASPGAVGRTLIQPAAWTTPQRAICGLPVAHDGRATACILPPNHGRARCLPRPRAWERRRR